VAEHRDELTSAFFDHLATLDDAAHLRRDRALMAEARELKQEHLQMMVSGRYTLEYVGDRLQLARLHAQAGLSAISFIGAFGNMMRRFAALVMAQDTAHAQEAFLRFSSLQKIAYFDLAINVDAIIFEREKTIRQQAEALRELSTPVLQVRERLLILPLIGVVDTLRARQITESLLRAIRDKRAKVVVLDITGVPVVDSKVANHLMQTVTAARLMGTIAIVTGLSAEVAQALVTLGVDLGNVRTSADLQSGLEEAEELLGYSMVRTKRVPTA
jgi:rsbT co-antagonist protein RsbR